MSWINKFRITRVRQTLGSAGWVLFLGVGMVFGQAQNLYTGPTALPPQGKPQSIQNVGIDQRLDQQIRAVCLSADGTVEVNELGKIKK